MEMPSNSWSDGSYARYGHPVFVPIGDSVDPSVETVISPHTPSRSIDLPETHWPSILSQNGRFHEENVLKITIWRAVCPLWLPQMFPGESETRALKWWCGKNFHLVHLKMAQLDKPFDHNGLGFFPYHDHIISPLSYHVICSYVIWSYVIRWYHTIYMPYHVHRKHSLQEAILHVFERLPSMALTEFIQNLE